MKHVIEMYKDAFSKHGDSNKSVFWPKGKQNFRYEILCQKINQENFSILDYGSGLGDLYKFLNDKFNSFNYTGVDIVDDFILFTNEKYLDKNVEFFKIDNTFDVVRNYDYIVASGTFNVLFSDTYKEHFETLKSTITHLLSKTDIYLAINFLSKNVDFIQDGAYHQDVMKLYNFVIENLSKRVIIDQSYMPYEFTIIIYKEQVIEENIYLKEKIQ